MSSTRNDITRHALDRFNRDGVESVGIRELARELGLSPGNLSYHFPKKDDLVAELARQFRDANDAVYGRCPVDGSLADFMGLFTALFGNHIRYRFLPISIVHVFETNSLLKTNYRKVDRRRRELLLERLVALQRNGDLRVDVGPDELTQVVADITLIARFWLSETRLSF
ncbi:MAG: TetR family transcriptional regulator, partial [Myxococcales bacterium]|nr:TetR family transcriptional regulator [Myxococcales bacterium]